jgi:hypothetical protein
MNFTAKSTHPLGANSQLLTFVSGVRLTATLGCADESGDRPDDGGLGDQEEAAGEDEFGGAGAVAHPGGGGF